MGLDDARDRMKATTAAAAAQQVDWPALYVTTGAVVNPMIYKLHLALRQRVPVRQYQQQFKTERAAGFEEARRSQRRLKPYEFMSRHEIVGGEHDNGNIGLLLLDEVGSAVITVSRHIYLPLDPYPRLESIRLAVNLTSSYGWDVRVKKPHENRTGPDWYSWERCLTGRSPSDENLSTFRNFMWLWPDCTVFIQGIEECVVTLADHYQIPLAEVEG